MMAATSKARQHRRWIRGCWRMESRDSMMERTANQAVLIGPRTDETCHDFSSCEMVGSSRW
jgi:hypothetical protein